MGLIFSNVPPIKGTLENYTLQEYFLEKLKLSDTVHIASGYASKNLS